MPGWKAYNPHTGEIESGLYDYPWMVLGVPRKETPWISKSTIASFRTNEKAQEFVQQKEADYQQGESGFSHLVIENWNETDPPKKDPNWKES